MSVVSLVCLSSAPPTIRGRVLRLRKRDTQDLPERDIRWLVATSDPSVTLEALVEPAAQSQHDMHIHNATTLPLTLTRIES